MPNPLQTAYKTLNSSEKINLQVRLGVTDRTIRRWVANHKRLRMDKLERLQEALELSETTL